MKLFLWHNLYPDLLLRTINGIASVDDWRGGGYLCILSCIINFFWTWLFLRSEHKCMNIYHCNYRRYPTENYPTLNEVTRNQTIFNHIISISASWRVSNYFGQFNWKQWREEIGRNFYSTFLQVFSRFTIDCLELFVGLVWRWGCQCE